MHDHEHDCVCCSPVVGQLFREARTRAGIAPPSSAEEVADPTLDALVHRRTVLKTGAVLAGTAAAVSMLPAYAAAEKADVVFFRNGTILTVDKKFAEASAIAFRGDRILAVGDEADVSRKAGPKARIVDLAGRTMLPGFVDPHTHMLSGSLIAGLMVYVGVAKFSKTEALLAHLRALAAKKHPSEWLVARNFDPSLQEGPDALTFAELDAVSTTVPVFVLNSSGHLAYANRAAFKAAGIGETVKNPEGAEFVRDKAGKLTGIMKNNVAFLQILKHYPAFGTADPVKSLIELSDKFAALGLTTLSDLGMGVLFAAQDWNSYKKAGASGALKARMRVYPFYSFDEAWDKAGIRPGDGDSLVRVAGYKIVADGSNQGFTGLQREPYLNSTSRGLAYTSKEELKRLIVKRGRQGWPIAIHGNGDKAIDNILDALQAARSDGLDIAKLRPRIEHCSILHDDQIARMKELGVSASFLIGHVHYWGVAMRDKIFGPRKTKLLDRARSCEKAGVGFTIHSDFFVTDPNPLHMIEMAVTRRTWKEPDYVLAPNERVSVEAAIRAMTSEAAWQLGSEHEVGSLEEGKLADAVILEKDPRKVPPTSIKDIKISETWMGGRQTYRA